MARMKRGIRTAVSWYEGQRTLYGDLVANLRELIKSLLTAHGIPFVDVQGRAKTLESFSEKISKKTYDNPAEDVTDLAGLRVITLVESDIDRVREVLSAAFEVHPGSSVNKSEALGSDRVGYRSLHLICDLGADRLRLPEFKRFSGCKFEVQIRTALQHAWAEIEHDRGYKLRGALPSHLKRKFSLLAGLLELADTQFDELSRAVDAYAAEVAEKATSGDLSIELNSSSVRELLVLKFGDSIQDPYSPELWPVLIKELRDYGVVDLRELAELFTDEVIATSRKANAELAVPGLIRDAMLFNDVDKYFDKAWNHNWGAIDAGSYLALTQKYGRRHVDQLFDENDISREWDFEEINDDLNEDD